MMRVKSGIIGLDTLIGGGFRDKSINVVVGASGTGKTIFALQFLLKGIEDSEKGIYVSFDMDAKAIVTLAESLGWYEIIEALEDGKLVATRSRANTIDYLNEGILDFIEKNAEDKSRVVIDSLTPLITPIDFSHRSDINWFFDQLRASGTCIVTVEERFTGTLSSPEVALPIFLADSAFYLKNIGYGEPFSRTIEIIKHRASWHAEGVFPYRILPGLGIVIESDLEFKASDAATLRFIDKLEIPEKMKKRLKFMAEKIEVSERFIEKVISIYDSENK